ncbi:MAG: hypothetical protein C0501_30425 [Isosphaera sp.]|nr:hypothetical protein [Isosphaera sp.]
MALAKGTAQLGVGVDAGLLDELRAFARRRGETVREVVELAIRRHLLNPPPVPEVPPLPPLPAPSREVTPAKAARAGKAPRPGGKGKRPT